MANYNRMDEEIKDRVDALMAREGFCGLLRDFENAGTYSEMNEIYGALIEKFPDEYMSITVASFDLDEHPRELARVYLIDQYELGGPYVNERYCNVLRLRSLRLRSIPEQ